MNHLELEEEERLQAQRAMEALQAINPMHMQMQRWPQEMHGGGGGGGEMAPYSRGMSMHVDERDARPLNSEWGDMYLRDQTEDALSLALTALSTLGRVTAAPVVGTNGMLLPCGIRNELTDVMNYLSRLVALLRRPAEFMRTLAVAGEGFTLQLHPVGMAPEEFGMEPKAIDPETTHHQKRRRRGKRGANTGDSSMWPYLSTKDMIDKARKEIRKYAARFPYAYGLDPLPQGVNLPPSLASEAGLVVVACLNKELNVPLPAESHTPVNSDLVSSMKMIVRTYAGGLHQYYVGHLLLAMLRIMKDKAAAEGMMTLPREYKLAPVEAEVCSAVVNLDADIFLERIEELRNLYKPFLPYPDALEEQHMMSMEHHPHMEEHHHQHGHMQEVMHPPGGHHDPHHDPHGMLQHHHQQHPGHPHHDEGQVPHPHAHHMEHQIHHHPEHHHEQEMHHHHHHHHEHHPHPEAGMMVQEGEEAKEESKYSAAEVQYLRDIAETLVRRVGDSICLMLHEDMSFTSPLKVILWRSFKDGPSGSVTQRKLSQNSGPVSINDYNEKVPVASEAAMTVRILSLMAKRAADFTTRLRHPTASVSASSAAGLGVPIDQRENRSLFKASLDVVEARRAAEVYPDSNGQDLLIPYDETNPKVWLRPGNRMKAQ